MRPNETSAEAWRTTLLPEAATFKEAIACLDRSGMQLAIVVNHDGRLVGTLTDGDIRRGLLRGLDLDSPVASIIQREPTVVPPQWGRDTALQLMRANKIHQLPVVDEDRTVVGLHLWDDLLAPAKVSNTMVIMAGGRGRRLMPDTDNCPKPMLPIGGKPMLAHIIERAVSEGFQRFVISVHYLGHIIEDYFGNGQSLGVEIGYLREDQPLGTAGALSLLSAPPTSTIVVTNGDVLTDIRYSELLEFHRHHRASATMAVRQHEWQHPFGVVKTQGAEIIGFEEKPVLRSHINAGIYALEPSVLKQLERGQHCDMPALFDRLKGLQQRVIAYPMHEPWLDVGRPDDLKRARESGAITARHEPPIR
jgi:dTDP-glucose pyrophosphorylase